MIKNMEAARVGMNIPSLTPQQYDDAKSVYAVLEALVAISDC